MVPDVEEFLPPHVTAGKRKLHTGKHIAVRRNVAGGVTGAAGETIHNVFAGGRWRSAEFFYVAHQFLVMQDLFEFGPRNSQGEDGSVSIHLWRDRGIESVSDSEFAGQSHHTGLVGEIARHENVGNGDL